MTYDSQGYERLLDLRKTSLQPEAIFGDEQLIFSGEQVAIATCESEKLVDRAKNTYGVAGILRKSSLSGFLGSSMLLETNTLRQSFVAGGEV